MRAWSDTKAIVHINGILREIDRQRIECTPFKWCLQINYPIEFCNPLFKEMLIRWVGRNDCFVLKQTLVPFTVADVCIGLGLGVGGIDVTFDDELVGVVCQGFCSNSFTVKDVIRRIELLIENNIMNVDYVCRLYILLCFTVFYFPRHSKAITNMPFTCLDNIDNLYQYNWAKAVHTYVVNSLENALRMLKQCVIKDSLSLSGNVAVLQVRNLMYHSHFMLLEICLLYNYHFGYCMFISFGPLNVWD